MTDWQPTDSGIVLLGLLEALFIGLKLMGYIGWSWVWVLSPIWIGFCVLVGAIVILYLMSISETRG